MRTSGWWPAGLAVLLLAVALLTGCGSQKTLTKQDVDSRAQEYFQRGMSQYQGGDLRRALESFRLAKAYDPQSANPQIAEMIEKAEQKLRIAGPRDVTAQAAGPTIKESSQAGVSLDAPFRTFRSRLYPYVVDIPESWAADPAGTKVANTPADLLLAPRGAVLATLTVVAHLLPDDIDQRGYVEAHLKLARGQGSRADEIGKRLVDGFESTLVRGRVTDERGKVVATQAIFATERVGWSVIFTVAESESDRLQPLFQKMLDTFKVTTEQSV